MRVASIVLICAGILAILYAGSRGPGEEITLHSALAGGEVKLAARVARQIGLLVALVGVLLGFAARLTRSRPAAGPSGARALDDRQFVEAIESLARQRHIQLPAEAALISVLAHIRSGDKIQAIKAWREATGAGLAESKGGVEALEKAVKLLGRL